MEQQQQQIESDKQFMSDNGWQCVPYNSLPVYHQAQFMRRDIMRKGSEEDKGSEEEEGDSILMQTIKRLRRNKINCQPRDDLGLSVRVKAMMMRNSAPDNEYAAQVAAAKDGHPRKEGGKKRSYKKRTNAKKRSTKKRTNAKKRSYKKRN
jgi:hypothetical protein